MPLTAASQWEKLAEPGQPMGASLGPGGAGGPGTGRGAAASLAPSPESPERLRRTLRPLRSPPKRWQLLLSSQEVGGPKNSRP